VCVREREREREREKKKEGGREEIIAMNYGTDVVSVVAFTVFLKA
jgi:hypothetical protein